MSLGTFRKRPIRRRWVLGAAMTAAVAAVALFVASASGVLSGSPSSFESGDGNMVVDMSGNNDWASVDFTHVVDVAHNGTDDSFTPGQKQDTTCPDVSGHQNPPKDDFTDVASYTDVNTTSGDTYLYGATIRYAPNGNASENVEFKHSSELCPGQPTGGLTVRSAGDKLLTIDYLNGGTDVHFHVLTWITTNDSEACYVGSDTAPCWGANQLDLGAAGAEGAASQSDISAADNPISNADIKAGQFAEFGVNLATAGIIPSKTCEAFPQTVWESRASGSSFVSTTKDISIENKTISNCGTVIIRKVTDPADSKTTKTSFGFTTDVVTSPSTTTSPFSLTDGEHNTITNVLPSSGYNVTEDDPFSLNYKLDSIDCSASDVPSANYSTDTSTRKVTFSLASGETLDCTFTNVPLQGALKILKESTKSGNPLVSSAGAEFCYGTSTGCSTTDVIDNDTNDEDTTSNTDGVGVVCVSGLTPGPYYVNETSPPSGYGDASQSDVAVTVVDGTDCGSNEPSDSSAATATFTNEPLADIRVSYRDGGSDETSATLACKPDGGSNLTADSTTAATGWDKSAEFDNLDTGTYICTVVIDP